MILLDTNVISELMRPEPAPAVVGWVTAQSPGNLYTTSITEAEILYGVFLLPNGKRRTNLLSTAETMFGEDFAGRVLGFDSNSALQYAEIASIRGRSGRPISHFDAQIAGIARANDASVATRDVADFEGCGIEVVNPWA